jgi:hypothetical protein
MGSQYSRSAALERAKVQSINLLRQEAARTILKLSARAFANLSEEMRLMLTEVASDFADDDAATRAKLFQQLGEAAQQTMLRSYDQVVKAREGPASQTHYRAGAGRLAGGVMRQALGNPAFFRATSLGLEWGNREMLDGAAAQWHRLNFGAGGRGGGGGSEYPVRFGGSSTTLGFDDAPSPSFSMPEGVWISPESGGRVAAGQNPSGTDMFYPQRTKITHDDGSTSTIKSRPGGAMGGSTGMRATRGIEGKHFMEAGLRRIAQDLPTVLDQYVSDRYRGLSRVRKRRQASSIVEFSSPASLLEIEIP